MKTETTSGGMGKLILRLILSILLVFSLLGTVGCAVGISVLHSPSQLIAQMHKQNAGQKVYDSLQTRFTTDYNTTAVPANVYMDAISVDWLEQCMEQKLTALYGADSDLLDFSALESSITDYFEKYAEENHYVKDDTYNEKLQETIDNGEKIISDATDLLRKDTLQKAGYLSKLEKLRTLTFAGAGVCGVLTVLLLVLLRSRGTADCRSRCSFRHRRDSPVRAERGGCLRSSHRYDDCPHHGSAGGGHRAPQWPDGHPVRQRCPAGGRRCRHRHHRHNAALAARHCKVRTQP